MEMSLKRNWDEVSEFPNYRGFQIRLVYSISTFAKWWPEIHGNNIVGWLYCREMYGDTKEEALDKLHSFIDTIHVLVPIKKMLGRRLETTIADEDVVLSVMPACLLFVSVNHVAPISRWIVRDLIECVNRMGG